MSQRRFTRRGLLRTGAAAGLMVATGQALAAQSRGGVLRMALPADALELVARRAAYDCLTEIAAGGELIGELAESWEPSEGARAWAIALRRGARFDGDVPVTAEDVLRSLAGSPLAPAIAGMEAPTAHRVTIHLHAPDPNLPFRLADPALAVTGPEGEGSGLYRIAAGEEGPTLLLRQPGHYKDGRAGWFDRVELMAVEEDAARAEMLEAGLVDAACRTAEEGLRIAIAAPATPGRALARPAASDGTLAGDDGRIAERWWFA
ncbi:ABC transporter substrate-binding protein [Pseudoroseicyclus tamaricis]|uniref:Peptide ABC transporter substrate-binding protein n=1 Tax=Pseudoroseicyclus tamaricis TaxID=2705421 RepID=A0A6B2K2C4_9RHOB|nr:ABC transporter substrate-binding protein [Pseudoroseicyclus tamaricis]NDV02694.1 peptide ABC transporter substrate-binding protein [Pseudoroseicyclus tamaricis]